MHNCLLAANLLIQDGDKGPLLTSDIMSVQNSEGWLYRSAVMSVKSRKIIVFSIKDQLREGLATKALKQAVTGDK